MKTTEIKTLWKLVKSGETRKLSAADMRLLLRVRAALKDYEAEVQTGHPVEDERCLICKEPLKHCRC